MTSYDAYNNGVKADVFLKKADGSIYEGNVWPGPTAFPDWFHSNMQKYWDDEFAKFFDPITGIDIDALWIDMNEPSNFCDYPCPDPDAAKANEGPEHMARDEAPGPSLGKKGRKEEETTEHPNAKRSRLNAPSYETESTAIFARQNSGTKKGLPRRNLLEPPYKIQNTVGPLSNQTAYTDLVQQGGWTQYDTHNL
jgi:alpha-glucosidase